MLEVCVLPPEYHQFERNGRYLFIDPRNFIWFSTDDVGKLIIKLLDERAGDINDVIEGVAEKLGGKSEDDLSRISSYVVSFTQGLLKAGFLHVGAYVLRKDLPRDQLPRPQIMYLHLSNGCNLRCPYCYNQEHRFELKREKKELPRDTLSVKPKLEHFLRLIDQAAELGFREIKLTGGEALLNRDALLIARYARHKGLYVNLLTNATLITTTQMAEQVVASVDAVSISLDSKDPERHDAVRGVGTHGKVLAAIRLLRESGLKNLHINGVVTPMTVDSVDELLKFTWDEIGADQVTISGSAMQVSDPGNRWGSAGFVLNDEQYASLDDKAYEFYRTRENGKRPPAFRNQCGIGNGLISVDSNGDVYPCQTLHEKDFLSGNVFASDLKYVLDNSDIIKDARNTTVDTIEECNVCPVRYICSSGCRSEAWTREGSIKKRNKVLCPTFFKRSVNRLWDSLAE